MNLIVDIGNTQIKFALFERQTLLVKGSGDLKNLIAFIEGKKIQQALVSSVTQDHKVEEVLNENQIDFRSLTHETVIPISNEYKTKETLGDDRLANVVAASQLFPNQNTLVIDCGTCIKYDALTGKNQYFGGSISPGLVMRFKALNHYTGALPLVEPMSIDYVVGKDSNESILSGVINGCVQEIEGIIGQYQSIYEKLTVILTGGDASFFDKELKSNIFVESNLTLIGLNEILLYNTRS